jgi:hypothetical protein
VPGPAAAPASSTASQFWSVSTASTTALSSPGPESITSASPSRALTVSDPNGTAHREARRHRRRRAGAVTLKR